MKANAITLVLGVTCLLGSAALFANTESDGIDIENHYRPVKAGGPINDSQLQQYALPQQALAIPLYEPEDQIATASYVHGAGFRSFKQMPENAYDIWLSDH